ncbi:hypothetical protein HMPREF9004_0965 [Schaalia cardiffensis F0333]|uniref:Cell division protein CrgA n=1 Tax=Schaalia cardiffensis F0333 TaxID=888050 RepID=N6X3U9_9ACTO|nr:hypothetical protein HMPREF9004_0965 [Schaalia cardiffensis F0333]
MGKTTLRAVSFPQRITGTPRVLRSDVAESKKRKKDGREVSDDTEIHSWTEGIPLSPRWWAPAFVTLLLLGLVWLMVYYISSGTYPIPNISWWNMVIGLGIMMVGFLMTLKWR